ncbi:hypothetical protein P153DRAFT_359261 [Dothidotthia symphoricarpi CBS 119687]|uniref:Uncharacterized protein n=1 Tax=Dothidotthia symphoricarpi CBS 119687 TaxID=1392245 RepID=A0A6A6A5W1_9PLEO|nr:uncharacterized protein P153DRAFT_359261 [Dothidotthia symphoricarpi CBS 119687]KAF2126936.1 hypothetical protein P153DRAFT_359261 [Dothidotthia symphoricarpi CBS 119687]
MPYAVPGTAGLGPGILSDYRSSSLRTSLPIANEGAFDIITNSAPFFALYYISTPPSASSNCITSISTEKLVARQKTSTAPSNTSSFSAKGCGSPVSYAKSRPVRMSQSAHSSSEKRPASL